MAVYNILDFGAKGDGATMDTGAIQAAVDACVQDGGGQVLIPAPGVYYSGGIVLGPNVDFHLERGATILASSKVEDYVKYTSLVSRPFGRQHYCLLFAQDAENISISGFGTFDCNSEPFMGSITQYYRTNTFGTRPNGLCFNRCDHLTLQDFTLKDSPSWCIIPAECDDLLMSNLRILNRLDVANCDGPEPVSCSNVRIIGCHVECADDCLVFKTTSRPDGNDLPCENVVVSGCTLISTSAAIKLGAMGNGDYRNFVIGDCNISRSNRALSIQIRDKSNVSNILFHDITIETRLFSDDYWGKAEPIQVSSIPRTWDQGSSGHISNVKFRSITCKGENGAFFYGMPDNPLEDIVLEDVDIQIVKASKWPGGKYDLKPWEGPAFLEEGTNGVYAEHVDGLTLRNVRVRFGSDQPDDCRNALRTVDVKHMNLQGFHGRAAKEGLEDIVNR